MSFKRYLTHGYSSMAETTDRSVWVIDPIHSKFRFEARYLLLTCISGWFPEVEGVVIASQPGFTDCNIEVTIYTHSVFTGNEERDNHLRSADFLDAARFPAIRFQSLSALGNGEHIEVEGVLTVKGITRPVQVTVAFVGVSPDPMGNIKAGFQFSTVLSRRDFNITWNKVFDTGNFVLEDPITVSADIQLMRITDPQQ